MVSIGVGHKKGKARAGKKQLEIGLREQGHSDPASSTSGGPNEHSDSPQDDHEPPRSPVPSEDSSATTTESNSSNISGSVTVPIHTIIEGAEDAALKPPQNTISAKIEVLQGGCLAGESIPLKVSIKHHTAVKTMQGIIITLYRQGRIDTHPAIPLGPRRRGEKPKYEDYYPKSVTGLGGLSLTSAGSSRSFRQDLNQIFAPIIVDPQSLTAVIGMSIQAPVHLFPTINCVPGAMISFKYYVEVVVDLRAKIGSQDRLRPHLSMTSALQHGYGDAKMTRIESSDGVSYATTPGFNYLVTDQLRRTKGVVFTRTEIIVGTKDNLRKHQKQRGDQPSAYDSRSSDVSPVLSVEITPDQDTEPELRGGYAEGDEYRCSFAGDPSQHRTITVTPPVNEQDLDEKTRLRRAEERLLPSAPPQDYESSSSSAAPIPSAPIAIDEEDFLQRYGPAHPAPAYEALLPPPPAAPQEDKMELERQRLLAQASAPPDVDAEDEDDGDAEGASSNDIDGRSHVIQPSAPVLYEDDVFDINDPRIPQAPVQESPPSPPTHPAGPSSSSSSPAAALRHDEPSPNSHDDSNNEPRSVISQEDVDNDDENLPLYKR